MSDPTSPILTPLRLHIGGTMVREGWKILNIQPLPGVDFIGTCTDLSQFANASVDEIYASHVYEHLSFKAELPKAFAEAARVLKPNGIFRMSVPDLEILCRLFLHPQLNLAQRFTAMKMMFGGQTDAHDFHHVGLTLEFVSHFLNEAGFRSWRRVENFGMFDDLSTSTHMGIPISINVEAVR